MTLNLGLGLALVCAALTQLGFLCKHRGANAIPSIDLRRPLRSARALIGSRWFAIGMAVTGCAWLLHVAALGLAPLSVVQAVLSTGVVMLAVFGGALFGCTVSRRQWLGVAMTAAGLVLLVVTLPRHHGSDSAFAWPALLAFEAGDDRQPGCGGLALRGVPAAGIAQLSAAVPAELLGLRRPQLPARRRIPSGVAAHGPLAIATSPWVIVAGVAAVLAFLTSARGFQQGDAVPVIACTSTGANVTCILGGILVFGDALASDALLVVVQVAAFALVAVAAVLTPAAHGRPPAAALA